MDPLGVPWQLKSCYWLVGLAAELVNLQFLIIVKLDISLGVAVAIVVEMRIDIFWPQRVGL